jgi:5-methylcytosine-specific restriction protein A
MEVKMKTRKHQWFCEKTGIAQAYTIPCVGCDFTCKNVVRQSKSHVITRAKRKAILQRDRKRCTQCGNTEKLTVDHLLPICEGGKNDSWNLTTLCHACNNSKGDKLVDKFLKLRFNQRYGIKTYMGW